MELITEITKVFGAIGDWIITLLNNLVPLFWTEGVGDKPGSLTFFGILAMIGLAVSVFFLLMRVVENFIHLRS